MILLIDTITVHKTTKIKSIDVNGDSYAEYNENPNKKDPRFKVGDHVRISKYKNIFAEGYAPNWSEEVFVVSKIKNTVPWTYVINGLSGEKITGSFYEKELQKSSQKEFKCMVFFLKSFSYNYLRQGTP